MHQKRFAHSGQTKWMLCDVALRMAELRRRSSPDVPRSCFADLIPNANESRVVHQPDWIGVPRHGILHNCDVTRTVEDSSLLCERRATTTRRRSRFGMPIGQCGFHPTHPHKKSRCRASPAARIGLICRACDPAQRPLVQAGGETWQGSTRAICSSLGARTARAVLQLFSPKVRSVRIAMLKPSRHPTAYFRALAQLGCARLATPLSPPTGLPGRPFEHERRYHRSFGPRTAVLHRDRAAPHSSTPRGASRATTLPRGIRRCRHGQGTKSASLGTSCEAGRAAVTRAIALARSICIYFHRFHTDAASRALLLSQGGPHAARAFRVFSISLSQEHLRRRRQALTVGTLSCRK